MIYPTATPFLLREGNWLEKLREDRFKFIPKKERKTAKSNENFMTKLLKQMTAEQMKGYLKGLNK